MKNVTILFILGIITVLLTAFSVQNQQKPWEVPAEYISMKNPIKGDAESAKLGKELYTKHCQSCHGKKGLGDGPKAAQLETPAGDFTTSEFKKQADGELFYKSVTGRDDMPSFKKKIPDEEEIWSIINYVRTF